MPIKYNNEFVGAARDGDLNTVVGFLNNGLDPNTPNIAGATAVALATLNGHEKIVDLLLKNGASPDPLKNPPRSSALIYAATRGHHSIIKKLLECGATVDLADSANQQTALIWACAYGRSLEVVKLLLEYGANKNYEDMHGNTPLSIATELGFKEIVEILKSWE